MAFSNLIGFFIIVTTAATLHAHGITRIDTASQAAEALRPIAGELTFTLFAAGLIGTGLLAVPVLAGSAAYALAEVLGLKVSLEAPAGQARGFYVILGLATIAGVALAAMNLDPIAMLFWSAVINGIAAVPIMVAVMLLVSSPLGRETFRIPMWLRRLGWLAAALMTVAGGALFWLHGGMRSTDSAWRSRLPRSDSPAVLRGRGRAQAPARGYCVADHGCYRVLASGAGYRASGIASWYGSGDAGRRQRAALLSIPLRCGSPTRPCRSAPGSGFAM